MIVDYAALTQFAEIHGESETDYDLQLQSAQEIVENHLGYAIEKSTTARTIYLDGNGERALNLGAPIISIESVTVDDVLTTLADFYPSGEFLFWKGSYWPRGERNVVIELFTGFEAADIPAIMKLTTLRIAAVLVSEGQGAIGVSSVSDPNTGSRTFMERTFKRYLKELDGYRVSPW